MCTKQQSCHSEKNKKRNLSLARAKHIYDYLVKQGIDYKRIKFLGMRPKFTLGAKQNTFAA
ncbi:OmpA family protein [Gelidibacter salicanalis]|uniref:OmpA family protein n=1 Tax=Gelidibacter salicanalis TaxID=291193 RepID=A0A5C7ALE7_9FLAO|nr:OmpA family protein [Gelidibacter salicanalis]